MDKTSIRKSNHVEIVLNKRVDYQKSTGLERFSFLHNALPEINFSEIDTKVRFLSHTFSAPIMVSSMTGGFKYGEKINSMLARFCEERSIPLGIGSQRQAIENSKFRGSFTIIRKVARSIFVIANIGAVQVARGLSKEVVTNLIDMVEANAIAVHLNSLQEFIQPEGERQFSGVLRGIEKLVKQSGVPVVVKETGAGISSDVARKLINAGVAAIDISGSGGTSWAAVETLRSREKRLGLKFWDWGISTADSLVQVNSLTERSKIALISSGGIRDGIDVAKSIALGADMCSAAQPFLKALSRGGVAGLNRELDFWIEELKGVMFLTGNKNIEKLKREKLVKVKD
ncbi:MAG: type 2 isopentenyl-diphosphate Delta-isomerase [Candidatus Kryptoniota bacterium]